MIKLKKGQIYEKNMDFYYLRISIQNELKMNKYK